MTSSDKRSPRGRTPPPDDSVILKKANALRRELGLESGESGTAAASPSVADYCGGLLNGALDQMYRAREGFTTSSQNAVGTVVVFYTAAAVVLFSIVRLEHAPTRVQTAVACALVIGLAVIALWLSTFMKQKVRAGYDLYVAAVVHAAIVTRALGLPYTHQWTDLVDSCHYAKGSWELNQTKLDDAFQDEDACGFKPNSNEKEVPLETLGQVIAVWRSKPGNLFEVYDRLLGVVATLVGFGLITTAVALFLFGSNYPERMWPASTTPPTISHAAGGAVTSEDAVRIKVTKKLQPAVGHTLQIVFGPRCDLDAAGECIVLPRYRGRACEVTDATGRVLRRDVLPGTGDLFLALDD